MSRQKEQGRLSDAYADHDHPVPMMLGQFAQFSMPSMDHLPE